MHTALLSQLPINGSQEEGAETAAKTSHESGNFKKVKNYYAIP